MTETLQLFNGYDRHKKKEKSAYRTMTEEEVRNLGPRMRVYFRALDGTARMLTINGAVRTWKRNPKRVEVPIKYGLREYATFNLEDAMSRLLVKLEEPDGQTLSQS